MDRLVCRTAVLRGATFRRACRIPRLPALCFSRSNLCSSRELPGGPARDRRHASCHRFHAVASRRDRSSVARSTVAWTVACVTFPDEVSVSASLASFCMLSCSPRQEQSDGTRRVAVSRCLFKVPVVNQAKRGRARSKKLCHSHFQIWLIQINTGRTGPRSVGLVTRHVMLAPEVHIRKRGQHVDEMTTLLWLEHWSEVCHTSNEETTHNSGDTVTHGSDRASDAQHAPERTCRHDARRARVATHNGSNGSRGNRDTYLPVKPLST